MVHCCSCSFWFLSNQPIFSEQWLCGRVPDLQSRGCRFKSRPGLLCIKVYSAFHPSGVGKWVPAIAGKAKAGMDHSDCGWTCGYAGKTVKSPENTCHTWALLRWWFTMKRRYIKCMDLTLPYHSQFGHSWCKIFAGWMSFPSPSQQRHSIEGIM